MLELLLYKALFEMAENRADFVSQLFSRRRPANVDATSDAAALLSAYKGVRPDQNYQQENIRTIRSVLSKHGFQLSDEDWRTIDRVHAVTDE